MTMRRNYSVASRDKRDMGGRGDGGLWRGLPWVVSILLHLVVVLVAFFVVWSYRSVVGDENEVVVPVTWHEEYEAASELTKVVVPRVEMTSRMVADVDELMLHGDEFAVNAGDLMVSGIAVRGGELVAGGMKGVRARPVVRMYGVWGKGRRIVYLVDASGSLIDTFQYVTRELMESIDKLEDGRQSFTMIFFQGNHAVEVCPSGMKVVSAEVKSEVGRWVSFESGNIVPGGVTSPLAGIDLALSYRPDVVYLLSDNITGVGEVDCDKLLDYIDKAKRRHGVSHVAINTIQFQYMDSTNALKRIAEANDGRYRFVDEAVIFGGVDYGSLERIGEIRELLTKGDFESTMKMCDELMESGGKSMAELLYVYGLALRGSGRGGGALMSFMRVVVHYPDSKYARECVEEGGKILVEMGKAEQARNLYEGWLSRDDGSDGLGGVDGDENVKRLLKALRDSEGE